MTFTGFGFCHSGVVIMSGHIPGASVTDRVFTWDERSPMGEGACPGCNRTEPASTSSNFPGLPAGPGLKLCKTGQTQGEIQGTHREGKVLVTVVCSQGLGGTRESVPHAFIPLPV